MTSTNRKSKLSCKPLPNDVRNALRSGVVISTVVRCVEELVYNSIDANAKTINVSVNLSTFRVWVEDDGYGLTKEDLEVVGTRYYTSKIAGVNDLLNVNTYGFRGEALASIIEYASSVEIITKSDLNSKDWSYAKKFKNGKYTEPLLTVSEKKIKNHGLIISIQNLLAKAPVRQQRIDKATEFEELKSCLEHISLMNPRISLSLRNEETGAKLLSVTALHSVAERFNDIFGKKTGVNAHQNLVQVNCNFDVFNLTGFVSRDVHNSKGLQFLYVNKRFVLKSKIHKTVHQLLCPALGLTGRHNSSSSTQSHPGNERNQKKSPKDIASQQYPVYVINIVCPVREYDLSLDVNKSRVEFRNMEYVEKALENFANNVKVAVQAQNKKLVETKSLQQGKGFENYLRAKPNEQRKTETLETFLAKSDEDVRKLFGDDVTSHHMKGAINSVPAVRERQNRSSYEEPTKKQRRDSYDQQTSNTHTGDEISQNSQLRGKKSSTQQVTLVKNTSRKISRYSPKTHTLDIRALKRRQQSRESIPGVSSKHYSVVAPKKARVLGHVLEKFSIGNEKYNEETTKSAVGTPPPQSPGRIPRNENSDNESEVSFRLSRMSVTTDSVCNFEEPKSGQSNLIRSAGTIGRHTTPGQSVDTPLSGASFIKVDKSLDTHRVAKTAAADVVKRIRDIPAYEKTIKGDILAFVHSCSDGSVLQNIQREIQNFSNQGDIRPNSLPSSAQFYTPVQSKRPGQYTPNYMNNEKVTTHELLNKNNSQTYQVNQNPFLCSSTNNSLNRNLNSSKIIQQPLGFGLGFGASSMPSGSVPELFGSLRKPALKNNIFAEKETAGRTVLSADAQSLVLFGENKVLLRSNRKDGSKTSSQSEKRRGIYISSQEFPTGFGNLGLQQQFTSSVNDNWSYNQVHLSSSQTAHEKSQHDDSYNQNFGSRTDNRLMTWIEHSKQVTRENLFSPAEDFGRPLRPTSDHRDEQNRSHLDPMYNRNFALGEQKRPNESTRSASTFRESSSSDEYNSQNPMFSFSQQNVNANLAEYERQPLDLPNEFDLLNSQNYGGNSFFLVDREEAEGANIPPAFDTPIGFPFTETTDVSTFPRQAAPGNGDEYFNSFYGDQNQDPCENMRRQSLCSEYFSTQEDDSKTDLNKVGEIRQHPKSNKGNFMSSTTTEVSPYVFQSTEQVETSDNFFPVFSPARELPLKEKLINSIGSNIRTGEDQNSIQSDFISNQTDDTRNIDIGCGDLSSKGVPPDPNFVLSSSFSTTGFRSSWLRRFFPAGASKFWIPEESKEKIQPAGNLELLKSTDTVIADAVYSCFAETEEELFVNKWRKDSLNEENLRQSKPFHWDGPQLRSTEVPVVNLRASEMQIWRKKVDIAQGSSSCRFTKEDLSRTVVVGNVDRKFIAAKINVRQSYKTNGDGQILVLFDQHAVHERIRLERMIKDLYEDNETSEKIVSSVEISPPIEMTFTDTEIRIMDAYLNEFISLGTKLEVTGNDTIKLNTVPKCFADKIDKLPIATKHETIQKLLRALIQEKVKNIMEMKGAVQQLPKTILNVLKSQACSGAIKFGDELSLEASIDLINDLKNCKAPFQCAHGRPVLAPLLDLK